MSCLFSNTAIRHTSVLTSIMTCDCVQSEISVSTLPSSGGLESKQLTPSAVSPLEGSKRQGSTEKNKANSDRSDSQVNAGEHGARKDQHNNDTVTSVDTHTVKTHTHTHIRSDSQ